MSGKVLIPERSREAERARWRASWQADLTEWLNTYLEVRPDQSVRIHDLTCPYCCPRVRPHGQDTHIQIEAGHIVRMGWLHPLRRSLPFWDRRKESDLQGAAILGPVKERYPGDHEVCPYDFHFRLQRPEAMGGYRQSGPLDGDGVRAKLHHGPTDDSFEMRWAEFYGPDGFVNEWRPGSFATDPAPDSDCEWISGYIFKTSRATRVIAPVKSDSGPIVSDDSDDRTTRGWGRPYWHPDKKFIRWKWPLRATIRYTRSIFSYLPRAVTFSWPWDVFSFWAQYTWLPPQRVLKAGNWPEAHSFEACLLCLMEWATNEEIEGWRRKYWGNPEQKWVNLSEKNRKEGRWSRNRRKRWSPTWRTERKMRDLNARLSLENHGWEPEAKLPDQIIPPRYNVARMVKTVNARLYPAFVKASQAKSIIVRQSSWPKSEPAASARLAIRGHRTVTPNGPAGGHAMPVTEFLRTRPWQRH